MFARPWRTHWAPRLRPAPIIQNGRTARTQKHDFRNEPITYPTNPEVAVCQVTVFWLRLVVCILEVYREHVCSIYSGVRPLFLGQARLGAPQHATVHLLPLIFGGVAVTRPISQGTSRKNQPARVGPLDSPQRVRDGSGLRFLQRARTLYERTVYSRSSSLEGSCMF